jgi:hypothetical protein
MAVTIPKCNEEHDNYPCWVPTVAGDNHHEIKPHVRCKCGKYLGIALHHVHKDGRLTESFFHRDGEQENDNQGCQYDEYLIFEGYNGSEWPPEPKA